MKVEWWLIVAAAFCLSTGCFGPSEEQLDCYRGCGTEKDACILAATTAAQIQACDSRSARCTASCK
jgi:hypothetical protein